MAKLILFLIFLLTVNAAWAVVINQSPPSVPPEEVVRTQTIPARQTVSFYKGKVTVLKRGEQKVCYDKTNRKVLCPVEASPATPATPTTTTPAPVKAIIQPVQHRPSGPSQYDERYDTPIRSQYE